MKMDAVTLASENSRQDQEVEEYVLNVQKAVARAETALFKLEAQNPKAANELRHISADLLLHWVLFVECALERMEGNHAGLLERAPGAGMTANRIARKWITLLTA